MHLRVTAGSRKCISYFRKYPMHDGKTHEKHQKGQASGPTLPEVQRRTSTISSNNLTCKNWFHSLPTYRFHALLTLFSKSFSPFPHGTCLLSVSNQYLALDEIYHPLGAPVPRNVTRRVRTVRKGLQLADGILTLTDALFQETYSCAFAGDASQDYNSRPEAPISMLSSSLFIRHYLGNPV